MGNGAQRSTSDIGAGFVEIPSHGPNMTLSLRARIAVNSVHQKKIRLAAFLKFPAIGQEPGQSGEGSDVGSWEETENEVVLIVMKFKPFLESAFRLLKEITMHRRNTRKLTLRVIDSSKIAMSIFFCSWRWFWILLMELGVWRVAETVFVEEGSTNSVEDQNGGKTMLLIDRNALNN